MLNLFYFYCWFNFRHRNKFPRGKLVLLFLNHGPLLHLNMAGDAAAVDVAQQLSVFVADVLQLVDHLALV